MFEQVEAEKIVAHIPDFNKSSKLFTAGLGFERAGTDVSAWLKGGVSYDVVRYEMVA